MRPPAGRVVEGDAGHEHAIEEAPSWGRGIWGQLFFWSLLRRAYRAPVSRLRELKHEPTPESLTCYINHLCIPVPGAE